MFHHLTFTNYFLIQQTTHHFYITKCLTSHPAWIKSSFKVLQTIKVSEEQNYRRISYCLNMRHSRDGVATGSVLMSRNSFELKRKIKSGVTEIEFPGLVTHGVQVPAPDPSRAYQCCRQWAWPSTRVPAGAGSESSPTPRGWPGAAWTENCLSFGYSARDGNNKPCETTENNGKRSARITGHCIQMCCFAVSLS